MERHEDKQPPVRRQGSQFVRFVLADIHGMPYEVSPDNFERCPIFAGSRPQHLSVSCSMMHNRIKSILHSPIE